MRNIFNQIERTKVKSNVFDLTHDRKFSTKFGSLTPVVCMDVVPGDRVNLESNLFVRFAPMIAPIMHRVNAYIHYFYVPNRIIWDGFEDFITGGENGQDETVWPYFDIDFSSGNQNGLSSTVGSLADYLGLPTNQDVFIGGGTSYSERKVSALPFAAYSKIWNDYYRDQNFQEELDPSKKIVDGNNINPIYQEHGKLRQRAWQHDYFTSALPWIQKGPQAMLPLDPQADVKLKDTFAFQTQNVVDSTDTLVGSATLTSNSAGPTAGALWSGTANKAVWLDPNSTMYADIADAQAESTIANLRRAFRLQEWLEKNARGGSRYTESIEVHFGVRSSDARVQRPEYLGGFSAPVKISEVLQTSETSQTSTPQGNMAGHAMVMGSGKKCSYYVEEHGYIMGILSVMPMSTYQQGIPKHFLRRDKFDYYWPEFAHIGEQAIEENEIGIATGDLKKGEDVWGYTPRYSEYKFIPSTVHGDMRTTLDFWHMGRKFNTQASDVPALNEDFNTLAADEITDIFAVQDGTDYLWCHVINDIKAERKMPYFGNPKF